MAAQQASELSEEEFLSGLQEPSQELSPQDFLAGLTQPEPKPSSHLGRIGGSFLEGLATIPEAIGLGVDAFLGPEPAQGVPGFLASPRVPGATPAPEMTMTQAVQPLVSGLKGKAQELYPEESRGQGGLLETLESGVGSVGAGLVGSAMGGPGAALAFGAQMGVPLYHDVLAKTGDKGKAMEGLLFGEAVGALSTLGLGKAASSIAAKLSGGLLGKAVEKATLATALSGTLKGTTVQLAQQGLIDAASEELTGEDLDNWQRIKDAAPAALLLNGAFHAVDLALSKVGRRGGEEIQVGTETPGGVRTEQEVLQARESAKPKGKTVAEIESKPPAEPEATLEPSPAPQGSRAQSSPADQLGGEAVRVGVPEESVTGTGETSKPKGAVEMFAGPPNPLGKSPEITTSKVKKWAKKWLRSEGNTPLAARRELEISSGAQKAEVLELARHAKALDKAMRKDYGKNWRADPVAQEIDRAFEGDKAALEKQSPEVQKAISDARAHLDRLIRLQVKAGGVVDPNLKPELAEKILKSQGTYANRFYKAHLDPEWANKVDPEVRQRLFTLWQSWAQPLSKAEAAGLKLRAKTSPEAKMERIGRRALKGLTDEEISGRMDAMLQEAKEGAESPWRSLTEGKLGRKNLSIYKARKGVPEELKAFLGEVKDPISNYANSVVKLAGITAKHEAFTNIRAQGLGKWLHEKPKGEFTARLSAENTPSLEPLDGLYTTPEIKEALAAVSPKEQALWVKGLVAANAGIKWGKVLGQPWALARNILGNVTLTIANGHLPTFFRSKEWKAAFGKLEDIEEQKRLVRLGVIGGGTSTAEWQDLQTALKQTPEELAMGPRTPFQKVKGGIEKAFEAGDNAPKIRFFYAEEQALKKAGYSAEEAEALASDRTRDLMPTTERMAPILKAFRKQPALGNYFSFRAEVIRTFGNRLRLIAEELKSDNPEVRAMGRRRAIGQIIAGTITPAAAYAINSLNGIDADEDRDRREFLPAWDENSRIIWFGGERSGKYLDLSDVDPFTAFVDPVMRVLGGASADQAFRGWLKDEGQSFVGPSPISKLAMEWYTGRDDQDRPIDNMSEHIKKQIQPGIMSAKERAEKTGFGPELAASVSGFRQYDFDVEKSLKFDILDFKRSLEESTSKRWRQEYKDPKEQAFAREQEMTRKEAFETLARKVEAATRLGIPRRTITKMLEDSLSHEAAHAIQTGIYLPYKGKRQRS